MNNLKKLREDRGLSQTAVANELGISRQTYNNYELGKRQADYEMLLKLAEFFGTTVEALLVPESYSKSKIDPNAVILPNDKVHLVPVFNSVSAGFGSYASSDIVEYIPLYIDNEYDIDQIVVVTVRGDSMSPKIEDGDRIVVRKQSSVDDGCIGVVRINDECVVKKIYLQNGALTLISLNPNYSPRIIQGTELEGVQIYGLVKQVIKTL